MNKERIDDLVDIIGDEYAQLENTFLIKNNQQLARYLDNPETWVAEQLKAREAYKNTLIRESRKIVRALNAKAEKVFLLSYREIAKDQIEITEHEIIARNIPKEVREQIKALKKFNAEEIANLASRTLSTYSRQVQIVDSLATPENLYDKVKEQMKQGIQNGIKVPYSNGRQYSWKAYMEMNIRTTIHQEMAQNQVSIGAKVGQIFYACDGFADCAPDHAKYQNRIYYNSAVNIPDEIMDYIKKHQILSMQEVMNNDPWLTTRPNCRHNFHAIPLNEALGMSEKAIMEKYNLSKGNYKGSNYEKRMQQRYNERMIRKYKMRQENSQQVNKSVGSRQFLKPDNTKIKIKEWQAKQRKLIASNPELLKREYDRENIKVITQDLGVRYDYSFKNGEIIKK